MEQCRFLRNGEMVVKTEKGEYLVAWWRGARRIPVDKEEGERLFKIAKKR